MRECWASWPNITPSSIQEMKSTVLTERLEVTYRRVRLDLLIHTHQNSPNRKRVRQTGEILLRTRLTRTSEQGRLVLMPPERSGCVDRGGPSLGAGKSATDQEAFLPGAIDGARSTVYLLLRGVS
jgi:hypothetical protein